MDDALKTKAPAVQVKKAYKPGQKIGFLLGPILFVLIMWVLPIADLSPAGKGVLATLAWVGAWWMTEAVPSGIAGLLPLILFPLTSTMTGGEVASAYGDPTIFLFLGGFALALAIERWNVHNRIALSVISVVGTSTTGLFIGILLASTFISMWVSNTATTIMMLPIGLAIGKKIPDLMKKEGTYTEEEGAKFEKLAIFGVAFGAIIGGSMTLIGTPTNITLSGFSTELAGFDVDFGKFMIFQFPLALLQTVTAIFYMTKVMYPMKVKKVNDGKAFVQDEKKALGSMGHEEKIVAAVFAFTVFMWLSRTFIWQDLIPGLSDALIAVLAAVLLYAIPAGKDKGGRILESASIKQMPWDVLLMIGGGLAIAKGFSSTDLAQWIGNQLLAFEGSPYIIVLTMVTVLSLAVTQMAPNTATGAIVVPIAATLAQAINVHPFPIMAAAALGAGYAYTFPSGTPTMGIIYATEKFTMGELIKGGLPMVIVSLLGIIGLIYLWLPLVFGIQLF